VLASLLLRGNLREAGVATRREAAEKAGRAKEEMRLFGTKGLLLAQLTSIDPDSRFDASKSIS
jgi:hypothetical protein